MAGEIISVTTYDWFAGIEISGFVTGGIYSNMGFGEYNSIKAPNSPKIKFTVKSSGFNANLVPTTLTRTVYGTTGIRRPYPNQAFKDEVINSNGNLIVNVALSDYIYSQDSQISIEIASGFYFNNNVGNFANNLNVTNGSTLGYPKVIAAWSCVPFERIVGSEGTLRCVAFHGSAVSGKPIYAAVFSVKDNVGTITSGTVFNASIDSRMNDALPVIEYIYNYSTSTLAQSSQITGNVKLFPIYGTTGEVLDSTIPSYLPTGIINQPTQWFMPMVQFCDKNNTYGVTVAVVDPINGNNINGRAVDFASFNTNNPPPAFQTIHSGIRGIQTYNNTGRSRNNIDAGVLLLKTGNYGWMGGALSLSNPTPNTHLIISGYPNTLQESINITGSNGTQDFSNGKLKIDGISIQNGTSSLFINNLGLWTNNCFINQTGGSVTYYLGTYNYFTANTIKNLEGGFRPLGNVIAPAILIRGNNFLSGWNKSTNQIYTFIGNQLDLHTNNNLTNFTDDVSAVQTSPTGVPIIVAYNKILRWRPTAGVSLFGFRGNTISGVTKDNVAIVQNLIEGIGSTQTPAIHIAADFSIYNVDNVIIWNNTVLGQRLGNINYNSSGSYYATRKNWSFKNNITDDSNMKDDTFGGEGGPSGIRTGNFPLQMGCGANGNIVLELSGIGAAGVAPYFAGINSYWYPLVDNPSGNFYGFNNRLAYSGNGVATVGSGDYTPNGASARIVNFGIVNVLPYDLAGNPRNTFDVGAYAHFSLAGIGLSNRRNKIFGGRDSNQGKNVLPRLFYLG